jgi:hypothetical protein
MTPRGAPRQVVQTTDGSLVVSGTYEKDEVSAADDSPRAGERWAVRFLPTDDPQKLTYTTHFQAETVNATVYGKHPATTHAEFTVVFNNRAGTLQFTPKTRVPLDQFTWHAENTWTKRDHVHVAGSTDPTGEYIDTHHG